MQAITITPQYEKGRYFIDLPDELKDRELIIQIILKGKIEKKDTTPELPETRLAKVRCYAGIAKEATIVADEEQWYQQ